MKFCFRPTDAPEKERLYICDFSHGRLNVRLSARIQPLLRGHKYRVFPSLGSVFGDTKGKKQPKVKKRPLKILIFTTESNGRFFIEDFPSQRPKPQTRNCLSLTGFSP